jgi:hypothetical protein
MRPPGRRSSTVGSLDVRLTDALPEGRSGTISRPVCRNVGAQISIGENRFLVNWCKLSPEPTASAGAGLDRVQASRGQPFCRPKRMMYQGTL